MTRFLLAVLLLWPTLLSAQTLQWSPHADRSAAAPLMSAALPDETPLCVFVPATPGVTRVAFVGGRTESVPPYDYGGTAADGTCQRTIWPAGEQTITATVTTATGVLTLTATILVGGADLVADPTTLEAWPSPDHAILLADVPLVMRYELRVWPLGGAQVAAWDLGRPALTADGRIEMRLPERFGALPPGVVYDARLAAIGPAGEAESAVSNRWTRTSSLTPPGPVVVGR